MCERFLGKRLISEMLYIQLQEKVLIYNRI